jgi:hypothetical protein
MAQPSRYLTPLSLCFSLNRCSKCLRLRYQTSRHFRSALPRQGGLLMQQQMPKDLASRMPARKSKKTHMKEMTANQISDDVGLLPQSFIRPPNRDLPRLFSSKWKSRLKVEWLWVRTRLQNLGSYVHSDPIDPITLLLTSSTASSTSYAGPNANSPSLRKCA